MRLVLVIREIWFLLYHFLLMGMVEEKTKTSVAPGMALFYFKILNWMGFWGEWKIIHRFHSHTHRLVLHGQG